MPLSFTRRTLSVPGMPGTPAVSHVRLVDFDGDGQLDVLGTDMRQGLVFTATPAAPNPTLAEVASIPHPAHVTLADVDKDGVQDLLVAEMGEFFPADLSAGGRGKAILDFFQVDRHTGERKGIVVLDLERLA